MRPGERARTPELGRHQRAGQAPESWAGTAGTREAPGLRPLRLCSTFSLMLLTMARSPRAGTAILRRFRAVFSVIAEAGNLLRGTLRRPRGEKGEESRGEERALTAGAEQKARGATPVVKRELEPPEEGSQAAGAAGWPGGSVGCSALLPSAVRAGSWLRVGSCLASRGTAGQILLLPCALWF